MSDTHQKPDLEDSINVTEAHGRVVREAAAAAREKRIANNGSEPISLAVLAACGVAAVIAGGIFGASGKLFAYDTTFRPGYVRTPAPGAGDQGPQPKEAMVAYKAKGAKIYAAKCSGCHGADAKGNGSTYPSLVGMKWPTGETERFAMIILNGLEGPVEDGKTYGAMPPQGPLTPEDLAGVMTYIRNNFGNNTGDIVSVEMAAKAIEISGARKTPGKPVTAAELEADHVKNLEGSPVDPKALVDPMSLKPAASPKP